MRESRGTQHREPFRLLPWPTRTLSITLAAMIRQPEKSAVLHAAIALIAARNIGMVISEEWKNLAKAVEAEAREKIEWRRHDELLSAEDQATQPSR